MNWLLSRLRKIHADQSGAVAFMVLCAILITLMMALVVVDTTPAARQKIEVQNASDTAAWSMAAVKSRTMNMLAFANVAKRVAVGQAWYYENILAAWITILALIVVVLVIGIILCAIPFTAAVGCPLAQTMGKTLADVAALLAEEATDIATFFARIQDRTREDLASIDRYQAHFAELTPWWGWGEAWRRGLRNGAYVSAWPVPRNLSSELGLGGIPAVGSLLGTSLTDQMPVARDSDMGEMWKRAMYPDLIVHAAEHLVMSLACCSSASVSGGIPRAVLIPLSVGFASLYYWARSGPNTWNDNERHRPWRLNNTTNQHQWYRETSNVVFAYRPGRDLMGDKRNKYGYLSRDYETLDLLYRQDGFMGMARSEFSYQNGAPDLWHPSWSARMRPVALPGEWASYDFRMIAAFNDAVPYLAGSAALLSAVGFLGIDGLGPGTVMGDADPADLVKALVAFDAMTDQYVEGVAR